MPAGTEDADAPTGSHEVCDIAGHCTTAGPIGGNKIDRKAPRLTLPAAVDGRRDLAGGCHRELHRDGVRRGRPASGRDLRSRLRARASRSAPAPSTCTATDRVGNTDRGSFAVTVRGAKEQLDRLLQEVVAAAKLPPAVKTQLLAQLRSALAQFDPSKPAQRKATCNVLAVFTAAVRLLSGHGVPPAQATQWIADANRIRAVIGCGS